MFKYGKKGSGGSGGSIPIYDEGVLVNSSPSGINFIGADVLANNGTGGIVNVFVPPPQFVSHFNTTDGSSPALVVPPTTFNRYVPNSLGDFELGDWVTPSVHSTVTGNSTIYSCGSFSILDNTSTTLTVRVKNGLGAIIRQHSITISGNYDATVNDIRIRLYNFNTDFTKYKAQLEVTINLSVIFPIAGRFSIEAEHNDGSDGIFTFIHSNIYYDRNVNLITISGVSINENTPFIKKISGISFYNLNSTFSVNIADIDNINNASYPTDYQVEVNGNDYNLPLLTLAGNALTNWTPNYNNINSSYSKLDWTIVNPNFFSLNNNAKINARGKDWVFTAPVTSVGNAIAINTMQDTATDNFEDFVSETYRLNSSFSAWNSFEHLNTYDGGNGLMILNTRLMYPQGNYTIYNPEPMLQPNYVSLTGPKTYLRHFRHANVSHSNGLLLFGDFNVTEAQISSLEVLIDISLDGIEWYSVNKNYLGGTLSDGAGCRIFPDQHNLTVDNFIQFTLGTGKFTHAGSNWGIYLRITYTSEALIGTYIGSLSVSDWV